MWASVNSLLKRRAPAPHRVLKRILRPWIQGEVRIPVPKKIGDRLCWVHPSLLTAEATERHIHTWIRKCVLPGQVFFDVGAHYGWMSLMAAHYAGAAGRVVAFEPAPPLVETLRYHKRINRLKQMEIVVSAVCDIDSESVPFRLINDGLSSGNSLVAHESEGRMTETTARGVTLDTYCLQHDLWPDVLKIDVEGAELLVLRGAAKVLLRKAPKLIVALHPPWLPGGQTAAEFFDVVASYGYQLLDSKVDRFQGEEFADYLFFCESPAGIRAGTSLENINAAKPAISAASSSTVE
jgi:FkbM family methyltransferase